VYTRSQIGGAELGGVDDPNFGSRGYFQTRSLSSGMSDAGSDPAAAQDFGVPEQEAKSADLEIGNPIPYVPMKSSQVDEERAESRCSSTEKRDAAADTYLAAQTRKWTAKMREIEMYVEQSRRMIADAWTDRNDPEKDHRYAQNWAAQNIQHIEGMIAYISSKEEVPRHLKIPILGQLTDVKEFFKALTTPVVVKAEPVSSVRTPPPPPPRGSVQSPVDAVMSDRGRMPSRQAERMDDFSRSPGRTPFPRQHTMPQQHEDRGYESRRESAQKVYRDMKFPKPGDLTKNSFKQNLEVLSELLNMLRNAEEKGQTTTTWWDVNGLSNYFREGKVGRDCVTPLNQTDINEMMSQSRLMDSDALIDSHAEKKLTWQQRKDVCKKMLALFHRHYCKDVAAEQFTGSPFECWKEFEQLRLCLQDTCHPTPSKRTVHNFHEKFIAIIERMSIRDPGKDYRVVLQYSQNLSRCYSSRLTALMEDAAGKPAEWEKYSSISKLKDYASTQETLFKRENGDNFYVKWYDQDINVRGGRGSIVKWDPLPTTSKVFGTSKDDEPPKQSTRQTRAANNTEQGLSKEEIFKQPEVLAKIKSFEELARADAVTFKFPIAVGEKFYAPAPCYTCLLFHYPVKGMNWTPTKFDLCIPCSDFAKTSKSPMKEQLEKRKLVKVRWEKWKKAGRPGKVGDFAGNTTGDEPEAAGAETSSEPENQELDACFTFAEELPEQIFTYRRPFAGVQENCFERCDSYKREWKAAGFKIKHESNSNNDDADLLSRGHEGVSNFLGGGVVGIVPSPQKQPFFQHRDSNYGAWPSKSVLDAQIGLHKKALEATTEKRQKEKPWTFHIIYPQEAKLALDDPVIQKEQLENLVLGRQRRVKTPVIRYGNVYDAKTLIRKEVVDGDEAYMRDYGDVRILVVLPWLKRVWFAFRTNYDIGVLRNIPEIAVASVTVAETDEGLVLLHTTYSKFGVATCVGCQDPGLRLPCWCPKIRHSHPDEVRRYSEMRRPREAAEEERLERKRKREELEEEDGSNYGMLYHTWSPDPPGLDVANTMVDIPEDVKQWCNEENVAIPPVDRFSTTLTWVAIKFARKGASFITSALYDSCANRWFIDFQFFCKLVAAKLTAGVQKYTRKPKINGSCGGRQEIWGWCAFYFSTGGPWMWYAAEVVPNLGVNVMIGARFMEITGSILDHGTQTIHVRRYQTELEAQDDERMPKAIMPTAKDGSLYLKPKFFGKVYYTEKEAQCHHDLHNYEPPTATGSVIDIEMYELTAFTMFTRGSSKI